MAFITCPNCGAADVSDKTISCPHCLFNVREYLDKKAQEDAIEAQRRREAEETRLRAEKEAAIKKKMEEARQKEIDAEPLPRFPLPHLTGMIIFIVLGMVFAVMADSLLYIALTGVSAVTAVVLLVFLIQGLRKYNQACKDPQKWKEDAFNRRMAEMRRE